MKKKLINSSNKFSKKKENIYFDKLIFILFLIQNSIIIIFIIIKLNLKNNNLLKETKITIMPDYNYKFAIIRRRNCSNGLFGYYVSYIACINICINNGYIPILDLISFPNIFNRFNKIKLEENPWELFFNQPFEYKLKNIKKYGKEIKYINCNPKNRPDTNIYKNQFLINYWHNLAEKYIPIKNEIINESNIIRKYLFNNLTNILGILIRGTDYISMKPRGHPIQPNANVVINDTKVMDKKYKYDWIFLTTEDEIIRKKFIIEIGDKLKFIKSNDSIKYNYNKRDYLAYNNNIKGNVNFIKIYLINIIILSKCIDILCSRTAGSVGAFIFSKGFRNSKVYYLGRYK